MHTSCYAQHCPCPNGWLAKKDQSSQPQHLPADLEAPSANVTHERPVLPETPKAGSLATALYKKFMLDMEAIQRGEIPTTHEAGEQTYPNSPKAGNGGLTGSSTQLVNLGVAPGASTSHVVQYGKPKEADAVKLMAFPKSGTSFEKWWEHCLDAISSATSFCTEAYRWALECSKQEVTFDELSQSGGFVRLDAMLLSALMDCIPGDTHLLRQEIKKAKTEQRQQHQRNITGRQVLQMVYKFFAMTEKDKAMTDTARLHKVTLQNGDIQQFVYRWDEMLAIMSRRPSDEDLMNLFVLQFDVYLRQKPSVFAEYLMWYNRQTDDTIRSYDGLWRLVHDWVRRKRDTRNRKEALKDHLPNLGASPYGGKGTGKGKDGKPQVCFKWRDTGKCDGKDDGTCNYNHPKDQKGTGKGQDGKHGKSRSNTPNRSSGKGKDKGGKGGRSASPKSKIITEKSKLCKNFLVGKCKYGNKCKFHHNGLCKFHSKGKCTKGADCIFGHGDPDVPAAPAAAADAPAPKPSKGAAAANNG